MRTPPTSPSSRTASWTPSRAASWHQCMRHTRRLDKGFVRKQKHVDIGPPRAVERGKDPEREAEKLHRLRKWWGNGRNRSLPDRIANSTCRICHQKSHWKRECPCRFGQQGNESKVEVTPLYPGDLRPLRPVHTVPPESEHYFGEEDRQEARRIRVPGVQRIGRIHSSFSPCLVATVPKGGFSQPWKENLAQKLGTLAKET